MGVPVSPTSSAATPLGAPLHLQVSSKASAAAPKLNNEMEMGSLPTDGQQTPKDDIMQLARVGDVPAMEKLFESGEFDATFTDDEGITPLHVRCPDPDIRHHCRERGPVC